MPTTELKLEAKVESLDSVAVRDLKTILWAKRITQINMLIVPAAKYINNKNKRFQIDWKSKRITALKKLRKLCLN